MAVHAGESSASRDRVAEQAPAARGVITTLGGAAGLGLEGSLYLHARSHAAAITWMLAAAPIAPLVIALFLPETASQELEEILPEWEA